MNGPIVEARAVTCGFGAKVAVDAASVTLRPGEVHAIIGENGAGKSTLLGAIAGLREVRSGSVFIDGQPLDPATPAEAQRRGVGVVHQHFSLVPSFTGLENLMLGAEPTRGFGVLDAPSLAAQARAISQKANLQVPLDVPVSALSVGERQRLEILRVLVRGARALLLDEPTAILTAAEVTELYALLRDAAKDGATVAVVTHHLDEVLAHADYVTVLRQGRVVHHGATSGETASSLAKHALGVLPAIGAPPAIAPDAVVVLSVRALTTTASAIAPVPLTSVSFDVRAGEITGIAGVDGNGQETLALALAGLVEANGAIVVDGAIVASGVPAARARGVEVILADRQRYGVLADATVHDNLVLGDLGVANESAITARRLEASSATPRDETALARELSGGNQQKIVVARALDRAPKVLVAAHPTRGIDAAASSLVRERIRAVAASGAAVVVMSGELGELRELAHRLVVLHRGRVVGTFAADVDEATLGAAMLGEETP